MNKETSVQNIQNSEVSRKKHIVPDVSDNEFKEEEKRKALTTALASALASSSAADRPELFNSSSAADLKAGITLQSIHIY